MNFQEIAFTTYPADNLAESRAFYERVLGLQPASVFPLGDDGGWVEYELGAHTFGLGKSPGWKASPDGPACALEAVDFDAVIASLRQAGAKFRMEPFETPVCRMAMVFDPAGNTLIVHRRKSNQPCTCG